MADVFDGTYDPKKVLVQIGPVRADGFVDGEVVKVTRNVPEIFKTKVGVTGKVSRSKVADNSGVIEFALMQTSASLKKFEIMAAAGTVVPSMIKNSSDRAEIAVGAETWIMEISSERTFSEEVSGRTIKVAVADLNSATIA